MSTMKGSDSTRLPPALLATLYRDSLTGGRGTTPETRQVAPSPKGETEGTPPSQGGFGRSVLILVSHADAEVIPDGELAFLTNILKACRLGLDDVLISNIHGLGPEGRKSLLDERKPAHLILFGMTPSDIPLPMSFPALKVQRHGPSQYLHAPSLHALQTDDAGKRSLWVALKQMFGIA
jgi:hypothetical protein